MAITVTERSNSRAWGTDTGTLLYLVTGTSDELAARAALEDEAPTSRGGLVRKAVTVEPIGDPTQTSQWDGVVRYCQASAGRLDLGEVSITVQIGGGTQHLTQALEHLADYAPPGETAPDHQGAIGVTHDSVEGVDVEARSFEFTVTKVFSHGSYPSLANLYALKGTYNTSQFSVTDSRTGLSITLAAGECLFRGATLGAARSDDGLEVTYQFAASPNVTNLAVGDITVASKQGWDYLWVEYEDSQDDDAKALVKRPKAAHVERVYDEGDFSALGL